MLLGADRNNGDNGGQYLSSPRPFARAVRGIQAFAPFRSGEAKDYRLAADHRYDQTAVIRLHPTVGDDEVTFRDERFIKPGPPHAEDDRYLRGIEVTGVELKTAFITSITSITSTPDRQLRVSRVSN